MYCVAESWINDQSENESRGQALSVYMIISMGGNAIGQLFLNFADPSSATLFMLVSILISLSLVPILITVGKQPDFTVAKILSIKELYKASPLGVISAIAGRNCTWCSLGCWFCLHFKKWIKYIPNFIFYV
jgi:hypothetical protein